MTAKLKSKRYMRLNLLNMFSPAHYGELNTHIVGQNCKVGDFNSVSCYYLSILKIPNTGEKERKTSPLTIHRKVCLSSTPCIFNSINFSYGIRYTSFERSG